MEQTVLQTDFGYFYEVILTPGQIRSPWSSGQNPPALLLGSTGQVQQWDLRTGNIRANSCCLLQGSWALRHWRSCQESVYNQLMFTTTKLWCKCTFRLVCAPRNHVDKSRYAITLSNFSMISQMHDILNMFKAWTCVTKLWRLDISCMNGLWQWCQNGQVLKKAPFFHHPFPGERESIILQKDLTPTTKSSLQQNLSMNMAAGIHLSWQPQERSFSNFLSHDILHKKEHIYY